MTNEELGALVAKLVAEPVGAVAKALQTGAQGVYQEVFNAGHKTATSQAAAEKTKLEGDLAAAKKAQEASTSTLEKMKGEQPDVAKIHEDYRAQMDDLRETHKTEIQSERDARQNSEQGRSLGDLRTALISHHSLDPDYADVLAQKAEVMERIRYDQATGIQIMQKGKEIPLQPGDDHSALDLLATELAADAPAKFVNSKGDRGSGTLGGGGGTGSGGSGFYDKLRERVKTEREAAQPANKSSAKDRLGIVTQ